MDQKERLPTDKSKIQLRLKKIEGQVRGIQKMIDSDSSCSEVLIQITAVKSAINRVGTIVFENHAHECLKKSIDGYDESESVDELMNILSKFIK